MLLNLWLTSGTLIKRWLRRIHLRIQKPCHTIMSYRSVIPFFSSQARLWISTHAMGVNLPPRRSDLVGLSVSMFLVRRVLGGICREVSIFSLFSCRGTLVWCDITLRWTFGLLTDGLCAPISTRVSRSRPPSHSWLHVQLRHLKVIP
jgi:hypothetical protein